MHVIWKRPDGFQNANPCDFRTIFLSNGVKLWLHKKDVEWYPFQVSGGWEGEQETRRLNIMINMLDAPEIEWLNFFQYFSEKDESAVCLEDCLQWLKALQESSKGKSWELDIIRCALLDLTLRLTRLRNCRENRS